MLRLHVIATLILLPQIASADGVGTVDIDMGGEERSFHTVGMERDGQTIMTASLNDSNRLSDLTIQAHPAPRFTSTDVISINASWMGAFSESAAPMLVEVMWFPESMTKPFYTSDQVPQAPVLEITDVTRDAETGHVTGTVKAKICRVPKLYEPPDMDDCIDIDATFDTDLVVN